MLKKRVNSIFLLISGIFFIITGALAIFAINDLFKIIIVIISYGLIFVGISLFILVLVKKDKSQYIQQLIKTAIDTFFGVFAISNTDLFISAIVFFFGLYFLCHAILHLINLYIYRIAKINGKLQIYFEFLLNFILSITIIFSEKNTRYVGLLLGIYFICIGIINITDFITEIIPKKTSTKIKRAIRIPLPILATLFIPRFLLKTINNVLQTEQSIDDFSYTKNNQIPDLFVIVHLANKGTATFGHVEIAFDDKIYSFGNYNRHSRMLFDSIGDGIIAVADKKAYMEYEITVQDRYLIEFGIKLTQTQKNKLIRVINNLITKDVEPYYPDLQLYEMGLIEAGNYHDISSDLYKLANAKFYRITKGPHKKFFVFKTNCVMLAEHILGSLGKNVIAINGIIAPGTYYEYLNTEFKKKTTNVITRKIYTKQNIDELK